MSALSVPHQVGRTRAVLAELDRQDANSVASPRMRFLNARADYHAGTIDETALLRLLEDIAREAQDLTRNG